MNKIKFLSLLCAATFTLSLSACDFAKNQLAADRSGGMEMQDYKDALAPRLPDADEGKEGNDYSSIPELQPYVGGVNGVQGSMPLVSISVNQTVPLRDVLYEVAQQAEYDIELDPRITGGIIFSARNKPLDEVIDRISDIAGLRYKFEGETLRVELDTPINKIYKVDYLSLIKKSSSSISNDISVVSGEGADTGSSFETSFENESDFWKELEANIKQILAATNSGIMRTSSDPEITAAPQQPQVVPVAAPDESGKVQVSPPDVNLTVSSLPTGPGQAYEAPALSYAINKQAGIIQVFAPQKTQDKVDEYLKMVKRSATAQVLIEAKILEVTLTDEYRTGIDWRAINLLSGELGLSYSTSAGNAALNALGPASVASTTLNDGNTAQALLLGYAGNDVQALVDAVSAFGTVKALASPRLTVLNNQAAVLNVATNRVFFEIDIESTSDGGSSTTNIDSELRNVPIGILVNVQPSINLDDGTISMAVRPTITNESGDGIADPGVAFAAALAELDDTVESVIPEVNVQEIDSVIKMRSGQAVVMGGLLQDRATVSDTGVPGLSEVPLLGNLFKQHSDSVSKTEVVILLKATILDDPSDSVHNTDKDLYRQFSGDRRPFKL